MHVRQSIGVLSVPTWPMLLDIYGLPIVFVMCFDRSPTLGSTITIQIMKDGCCNASNWIALTSCIMQANLALPCDLCSK